MLARNTRRPLCERDVRVGLGGKGKRVKQNQTDMIQLRRGRLQSVKVRRRRGYFTARMGFRHPHVSALFRHLLATLALGRCHCCTRKTATGSAASISARAGTPTLVNSLNITSLSSADSKTQRAGKGFTLPPSCDRPDRGLSETPARRPSFSLEFLIRTFGWTPSSGKCLEGGRFCDRA